MTLEEFYAKRDSEKIVVKIPTLADLAHFREIADNANIGYKFSDSMPSDAYMWEYCENRGDSLCLDNTDGWCYEKWYIAEGYRIIEFSEIDEFSSAGGKRYIITDYGNIKEVEVTE